MLHFCPSDFYKSILILNTVIVLLLRQFYVLMMLLHKKTTTHTCLIYQMMQRQRKKILSKLFSLSRAMSHWWVICSCILIPTNIITQNGWNDFHDLFFYDLSPPQITEFLYKLKNFHMKIKNWILCIQWFWGYTNFAGGLVDTPGPMSCPVVQEIIS